MPETHHLPARPEAVHVPSPERKLATELRALVNSAKAANQPPPLEFYERLTEAYEKFADEKEEQWAGYGY